MDTVTIGCSRILFPEETHGSAGTCHHDPHDDGINAYEEKCDPKHDCEDAVDASHAVFADIEKSLVQQQNADL